MTIDVSLYHEIKEVLQAARNVVYKTANTAMVQAYWQVGKLIVERQGGEIKAEYGTQLLKNLSKELRKTLARALRLQI